MDLFTYAVIKDEKVDKDENVTDPAILVVEPTTVLAKSKDQAALMAAKAIPDEHMGDVDRLRVLVSPFLG